MKIPTLHIICGLPCSGKTTLARQIERESQAVRLCPDEWIARLLPEDFSRDELFRLRDPVEAIQWELAQRLLSIGVDVIIEWGTWARSEREALRERAQALGASARLHYLPMTLEELRQRLEARNRDLPDGSFHIDPDELTEWYDLFEPPDEDELAAFHGTASTP